MMKILFLFGLFGMNEAIHENCIIDADCPTNERTICLNSTCTCDKIWYYSTDLAMCIKYGIEYNSVCYEDRQCELFLGDNSECVNNVCSCQRGYRWYQGKCRKYANKGEACDSDIICLDLTNPLALSCTEANICECSDNFYDRGADCRFKSQINSDCAINNDCFPGPDSFGIEVTSHCELGKCIKDSRRSTTYDNLTPQAVGNLIETFPLAGNSCVNGVSLNLTESQCNECSNTLYFKEAVCICQPGFFLENGECIAELGVKNKNVTYTSSSDCPIKPGKLIDGVCYCRDYWFQDSKNRECIKTTLQYTHNCMENEWCKAMGEYAFCNTDTGKCECVSQAVLNETSFYCNPKENANWTGICLADSECALYETCVNQKCQCTEGFYRTDDTRLCLPKIGYSCEIRNCNHIQDAICSKDTLCECPDGDFVTNGYLCLQPATTLNEGCTIEEQCEKIPNSSCMLDSLVADNATTRCLCKDEYLAFEGVCHPLKYPGSLCSTQRECTIILGDSFVCRNMLCQCPIGKTLDRNNVCVTTSSANNLDINIDVVLAVTLFFTAKYYFG